MKSNPMLITLIDHAALLPTIACALVLNCIFIDLFVLILNIFIHVGMHFHVLNAH